jgi:hypothetical protein
MCDSRGCGWSLGAQWSERAEPARAEFSGGVASADSNVRLSGKAGSGGTSGGAATAYEKPGEPFYLRKPV